MSFRGAHLLPCFGEGFLPAEVKDSDALDVRDMYLVQRLSRECTLNAVKVFVQSNIYVNII
jgi:hypothetical protein